MKFWFLISDSDNFFLPHLNSLASSCLWRLQRNYWRKEERRPKYLLYFWLYFRVQQSFCGWGYHSWIQIKWLRHPDKVLKCVSRLRQLISSNSVWSCPVVLSCCLLRRVGSLATGATHMRSPGESPLRLKGSAEVRANLSFSQGRFLF